jgi:hypothetical protein
MTESAAQSLHHRIFLPFSASIRRMALPTIDPTSAHLSYLILSLFLVSYALFCKLIRSRLHYVRIPAGHACRHSPLAPEATVSLICNDGDWEDDTIQEVMQMVVGVQVFAIAVELRQKKYMKINFKYRNAARSGHGYWVDGLCPDEILHPANQLYHSFDHRRMFDTNRSSLGGQCCRGGSLLAASTRTDHTITPSRIRL